MKWLYKYPQAPYPYEDLLEKNRERDRTQREYELLDTGVFEGDRYFDVVVEYAKATADDLLIRITATNRGPEAAPRSFLGRDLCNLFFGQPIRRVNHETAGFEGVMPDGHLNLVSKNLSDHRARELSTVQLFPLFH